MELLPGVFADHTAAYIPATRTLVLGDLHLGYEEELRRRGIFLPTGEFARVEKLLEQLINKHKPKTIVLNGDVKHGFGTINSSEWRHTRTILERLQRVARVILVEGNHDVVLAPVARAAGLDVLPYYIEGSTLFLHGDAVPEAELLEGITTLVMGHEHPAVSLGNGIRSELYKCFLTMPYEGRTLLCMPSTFSLTVGVDVLATEPRNPLLANLAHANVFVIEDDKALPFGTVKDLRKHLPKPER